MIFFFSDAVIAYAPDPFINDIILSKNSNQRCDGSIDSDVDLFLRVEAIPFVGPSIFINITKE